MSPALLHSRADIVGMLYALSGTRETKAEAEKADRVLTEIVKQWMLLSRTELDHDERGRSYLEDGEHGIRFFLDPRNITTWDLDRAPVELLHQLAQLRLLTVKTTDFHKLRTEATGQLRADLNRALLYEMKGEDYSLRWEKRP